MIKLWEMTQQEVTEQLALHSFDRRMAIIDYRGYLICSPDRTTPSVRAREFYRQNIAYALQKKLQLTAKVVAGERELIFDLCEKHGFSLPMSLSEADDLPDSASQTPLALF